MGRRTGLVIVSAGLNAGLIAVLSFTDRGQSGFARVAGSPQPLYLDIEPRERRARERASDAAAPPQSPSAPRPQEVQPLEERNVRRDVLSGAVAAAPWLDSATTAPIDATDPRWRVATSISRGVARLPLSCDASVSLSVEARRYCDSRRLRLAQAAPSIAGSGDHERDAVLARQGARRLAAWEAQRAEPPRGDPPCETPNPMSGCEGVNVSIKLFSTRDGLLPNLRKRRE